MAGPPLLEVSCATDVAVGGEGARRGGWAQWLLIEVVPQDRVQTLVADRTGEQSAFGSRFHAGRWIALAQADDAETRTVAHLGMRERRQDLLYHLRGLRTHGARLRVSGRVSGSAFPTVRGSPGSVRGARRTCDDAARLRSNAGQSARRLRLWLCRAVCAAAPATHQCRSAGPSLGKLG